MRLHAIAGVGQVQCRYRADTRQCRDGLRTIGGRRLCRRGGDSCLPATAARGRSVPGELLCAAVFCLLSFVHRAVRVGARRRRRYRLPVRRGGDDRCDAQRFRPHSARARPRPRRSTAWEPWQRGCCGSSCRARSPYLFTGIKLAIAYSFIGVIAAEFIMAPSGLGYSIAYAFNSFDNRTMYALMLFVIVLVTLVNALFHVYEQRLLQTAGALTCGAHSTSCSLLLRALACLAANASRWRRSR